MFRQPVFLQFVRIMMRAGPSWAPPFASLLSGRDPTRVRAGQMQADPSSVCIILFFESYMNLQAILRQVTKKLSAEGNVGLSELAKCLSLSEDDLSSFRIRYSRHLIPKKNGRSRELFVPSNDLKVIQARFYKRLLRRLPCHQAVKGFRRGCSFVDNATPHVGCKVVLGLDICDFFPSTTSARIKNLFCDLGWDREVASKLTKLCTIRGSLPQGAPTSPYLSNLVNYRLDCRLSGLAKKYGATYTRYADDLTFSFLDVDQKSLIVVYGVALKVLSDFEYSVRPEKTRFLRSHRQQRVTGLVVNQKVQLPREKRRLLRAIEHHLTVKRPITVSEDQLQGWRSLHKMVYIRNTQK